MEPRTRTLSLGSTGCSMDCPFCQNWSIAKPESSGKVPVHAVAPEALAPLARKAGVPSVSFTYNEPLVSFEYLRDAARLLREEGLASILVSNGMIEEPPLGEILPLLSAANIDLKAFTERGYALLGGFLGTVRRTIDRLLSSGVHVEVTFLLVPGINDEPAPFLQMVQWLSGLDPQPVLHISRYFPNRLWDRAPLSSATMAEYVERASSVLEYVRRQLGERESHGLQRLPGHLGPQERIPGPREQSGPGRLLSSLRHPFAHRYEPLVQGGWLECGNALSEGWPC